MDDLRDALDGMGGGEKEATIDQISSHSPACCILELPHRELGGVCTPAEVRDLRSNLGHFGIYIFFLFFGWLPEVGPG